ncbi:MAG: type III-A CRISPR-associated protein Cas10/Csm1 [Planctomycetes bacterium]|nr:type III-A CRISPR-associated protein Cas10/Csm1 [Planctomycetota bacterium]
MKDQHAVHEVVLAGLLHDIGKFYQRAAGGKYSELESKDQIENLCPNRGYFSHLHAIFTYQFCDKVLRKNCPDGLRIDSVTELAAHHHLPMVDGHKLITRADCLSSGAERLPHLEGQGDEKSSNYRKYLKVRLSPVDVSLEGKKTEGIWVYPLKPLTAENAFPLRDDSDRLETPRGELLTTEYASLWEGFLREFESIEVRDSWGFINRVLSLMEKYCWCIPADTNSVPEISLYDHSKTTAALAGALFLYDGKGGKPFLVVGGDFGGIQKFIMNVKHGAGGVAKSLRARSSFVQLVSEQVSTEILRRLNLPLTNRILNAGGNFTLLLPNTAESENVLSDVRSSVDDWSKRVTDCEVSICFASVSLGVDEFKKFSASRETLGELLDEEKKMPLRGLLQNGEGWLETEFVIEPLSEIHQENLCQSCGRKAGSECRDGDESYYLCNVCNYLREFGRNLAGANYIAFSDGKSDLFPFGRIEALKTLPQNSDAHLIYDLRYEGSIGHLPLYGRMMGNHVPKSVDSGVMTFEDIAKSGAGRGALAYLKMDVDNLGKIFRDGLAGENDDKDDILSHVQKSVSRVSTLSRYIDLFFTGWIDHLCRSEEFASVYMIYSGGDDVLCLGPWETMLNLAGKIREDFREYTCNNPSFTLSAGISLVHSHTPVRQAVDDADEKLEFAKHTLSDRTEPFGEKDKIGKKRHGEDEAVDIGRPKKDRLTVFETCLQWKDYLEALGLAKQLAKWNEDEVVGSGQIRRLLGYSEMYRDYMRTGDNLYFRFVPLVSYDIKRNYEPRKEEELSDSEKNARDFVRGLISVRSEDENRLEFPNMSLLHFVASYAINRARNGGGE